MLAIEPSPTSSDVPPSLFSARSSSIDLAPARLYTSNEIGMYDVLCGRDKAAFNNIGNRRFRVTVSLSLERYLQAATRKEKSVVIKSVVTMLHADGGKFLQQVPCKSSDSDASLYIELNEKQAHEKAGHALRDMALLRSKPSSSTLSKKNKAIDHPLVDSTVSSATSATTIASSLVASNKRSKRSKSEHMPVSTGNRHDEHLLPQQLDAWTELTWDESSELTHDESMFDILVESVVVNNAVHSSLPSSETIPTGMMIGEDYTTTYQPSTMDVVSNDTWGASVNDEDGNMDIDRISSTISERMNNKRTSRDTDRSSSASFTLDDEMVSWLVGESDCVMQI
jgi:hypothetical protein